jgi:hypothetical protein
MNQETSSYVSHTNREDHGCQERKGEHNPPLRVTKYAAILRCVLSVGIKFIEAVLLRIKRCEERLEKDLPKKCLVVLM